MPSVFFLILAFSIVALAHVYVAKRLFLSSEAFPKAVRRAGAACVGALGLFMFATMFLTRLRVFWFDALWCQLLGFTWFGMFCLLLILTIVRDLAWGISLLVQRFTSTSPQQGYEGDSKLSRRQLFFSASSATVLATAASGSAIGYHQARSLAKVKHTEVKVAGLPAALDGFKIVQISDLHIGPTLRRDFMQAVVDRVNELDADLVAITGDLVDGLPADIGQEIAPLAELKAKLGVFYVTGNHEYYWDAPGWVNEVRKLGVKPLMNAHEVVAYGGEKVVVAGATDYSAKRMGPEHASDPVGSLKGAPSDAAFKLLLAHQPKSIYAASEAGFDLQLSGHTHGGQFYPWNIIVGLAHPFTAGLGLYGATQIYVSRGTGYWGPPLRLGAPSEISEITLRRA